MVWSPSLRGPRRSVPRAFLVAVAVVLTAWPGIACAASSSRAAPGPRPSACRPPTAPHPTWQSRFADGTFDDWTIWQQPQGGTFFVTTPARAGLPPTPLCAGDHVAEFAVTPDQLRRGDIHSKLYKGWDVGAGVARHDQIGRRFAHIRRGQEAGTYSAWYLIPRDYRMDAPGPVNIFQFKEDTSDDGGRTLASSDMQYSVSLFRQDSVLLLAGRGVRGSIARDRFNLPGSRPILMVDVWHPAYPHHVRGAVPAPLGRWFEITARVHPHRRIAFYVNGRRFDVWRQSEYPVGVNKPNAIGWTFGVGHYGRNVGRLWVADASFTPFGARGSVRRP